MKTANTTICFLLLTYSINAQVIPFGVSIDSLVINTPPNTVILAGAYHFNLYKPVNYNNLTSPILWYIHGSGGSGAEGISFLQETAERRGALIISPIMQNGTLGWAYVSNGYTDTITGCTYILWSTQIFKQIYRYILIRESRDSIPVHLTGFSQGGQFVTRYMLIRQFDPDSIPIVMSASVNPANYTLCTDTFNGNAMNWTFYRCGLSGESPIYNCNSVWTKIPVNQLICNSHVKQYYNENYAVLIGTLDTATFQGFCPGQGGNNRYERAIAFYNFSDTNAITRGTTLQWQYAEIHGVGHNGYALYNTAAAGDSIPIAERVLFETPWHPVPDFSPVAAFSYSDSDLVVQFSDNSLNTDNWHWDFGDGSTDSVQNPVHTYTNYGTYFVTLIVQNPCGSDTSVQAVIITSATISKTLNNSVEIFPNPSNGIFTIKFEQANNTAFTVKITSVLGEVVFYGNYEKTVSPVLVSVDIKHVAGGIYHVSIICGKNIYNLRMVIDSN